MNYYLKAFLLKPKRTLIFSASDIFNEVSNFRKIFFTLVLIMLSFSASSSVAASTDNFGVWTTPEGTATKEAPLAPAYDSSLSPFNEDQLSESTAFVCAAPNGALLSEQDQANLAEIFITATEVYNGNYQPTGGEKDLLDKDKKQAPPENGGYPTGSSGLQTFLRNEVDLLQTGMWAPYDQRTIIRSAEKKDGSSDYYSIPPAGWAMQINKDASRTSSTNGRFISQFIDPTVSHPLALTVNLPEACALGAALPNKPNITDLFFDPGKFQSDSFLYVPTNISVSMLKFFQPYSFRWTFWTPHSEKGDLLWTTPELCAPTSTLRDSLNSSPLRAGCDSGTPLGFEQNSASEASSSWFLSAANFLQWFISGLYFLVIFIAAILYMVKGNRKTQIKLTTLLPRMVLAMVVTAFSGYIIGTLISFSNIAVQLVFNLSDVKTIGVVNNFLLQAGNIIGGGSTVQSVAQLLVSASVSIFFAFFVFASVARQIILIMLIILAPVAAFSLLSNRWQRYFNIYVRALLATVFVPVVLAFIMKVGLSINPLVLDPIGSYGGLQGLLGLILMLVTLYLMYKALRLSFEFARGGGAAVIESLALSEDNPLLNLLGSGSNQSGSAETNPAKLVPEGSVVAASSVQLVAPSQKVMPSTHQLPSGGNPPGRSRSGSPGQMVADSAAVKGETGTKRVSTSAAATYRKGLRTLIGNATASKGAPLTEEEVAKLKADYARRNGGKLTEQDGSFYLAPAEEVIVRSRAKE